MKNKFPTTFIVFTIALLAGCQKITDNQKNNRFIDNNAPHKTENNINNDELFEQKITNEQQSVEISDTGQKKCFNDKNEILYPKEKEPFYGQDAQYQGVQANFKDNNDGTVTDLNTGLIWTKEMIGRLTYYEAVNKKYNISKYNDWRIPTIKELYTLMNFNGIDPDAKGLSSENLKPFIDTEYFDFKYGDLNGGDRIIDSQWITSTIYKSKVMKNEECFFGVNFADGRIKCYPTKGKTEKGYFLRLVRGGLLANNNFIDNKNGTITDETTGLLWQKGDSQKGMNWEDALKYCEDLVLVDNKDWRLPNAKELQFIVDYDRSPDTTNSPAIDPIFETSEIKNEAGQKDYPFYWTSTTHENHRGGGNGVYISFGRAMGKMREVWMDVHGAGAQRSDPKTGVGSDYPNGFGPQGDARRINNYVRCVSNDLR